MADVSTLAFLFLNQKLIVLSLKIVFGYRSNGPGWPVKAIEAHGFICRMATMERGD
jgi:hypothetical protein